MGQEKQAAAKGLESLRKATDTLSTMLAQEVKDLNARQRAARRELMELYVRTKSEVTPGDSILKSVKDFV